MLAKNKNPKVSYIGRLLVLPLAAIVFFAFTLKVKNRVSNLYDGKTITVVIDAGHGGTDNGAMSADGVKEKNITLAIAKKIAGLNANSHIQILLSRKDDETVPVKDRVVFAKNNNANIFISIHLNSAVNEQLNGFSVLIDKNNSEQNLLLGSALIDQIKKSCQTDQKIGVRKNGIWILDENICPAALIECGFLSNTTDANFISNSANQQKIAENVLDAINNYASSNYWDDTAGSGNDETVSPVMTKTNDTVPAMYYKGKKVKDILVQSKSINIKVTEPAIQVTYEDGSTEMISKEESDKRGFVLPPPPPGLPPSEFKSNALFAIDGKISTNEKANTVDPKSIESINVLKGKAAIEKYGDKGKNGVIEITTKYKMGNVSFVTTDAKTVHGFPDDALFIVDGKEVAQGEFKNINPSNIESITILKGENAIKKYGEKGKNVVIEITKKHGDDSVSGTSDKLYFRSSSSDNSTAGGGNVTVIDSKIPDGELIFVDGKEIPQDEFKNISPKIIQSMNVLKGESAEMKYGAKGKNGVIEITTKKNGKDTTITQTYFKFAQNDTVPDKVFTKTEVQAEFPGGQSAWQKYIVSKIIPSLDSFTNVDFGTCVLEFIVNTDGKVSDVEATTMQGTQLAKISVNAIKNGPKWVPATQNGHTVAAYRLQPVTLANPEAKPSTKTPG